MKYKKKINQLNFNGQDFFIGIDVHSKSWVVTIMHNSLELKTFSMEPKPEILFNYMRKNYPNGTYHSVYEAGFCGFWIHRRLMELGFNNIVVNPPDIPTSHKEKDRKQDSSDSRKLARTLESDLLHGIFIPNEKQQAFRAIARLYHSKVQLRKKIKQRIKAFLHLHGIPIPEKDEMSPWSNRFITYLKQLRFAQAEDNYYFKYLLSDLQKIRNDCLKIIRHMRKITKNEKIIILLRTIPGIGFITAFFLYAELMDIRRFNNNDALSSFIGIVPSFYSTDDKSKVSVITKRHNKYLRQLLIEAAWIAVRKDPALTEAYGRYLKRMKAQKAIIRIARKLVNRIRYVWIHEEEYQIGVVA